MLPVSQLNGSAAEEMLSHQQIMEHSESESLRTLVKSTMATSGFKNVYLIQKGVHSTGKYIACGVNQEDDSTFASLGIFESKEQAALH
jgi:hypothetical protein